MYVFEEKITPRQENFSIRKNLLLKGTCSVGIALLVIGLAGAGYALFEACFLYQDPAPIGHFARYLEQELNQQTQSDYTNSGRELVYFMAWVVTLSLLFLMASISFSCIRTGVYVLHQDKLEKYSAKGGKKPAA